ncbi:hypothetical protein Tco_0562713 [Tanacetum coccineum]
MRHPIPSQLTLGAEFNVESSFLVIGGHSTQSSQDTDPLSANAQGTVNQIIISVFRRRRLSITKRVWIPHPLSDRVQLKIDSIVNTSGSNIDMVDADADFAASF